MFKDQRWNVLCLLTYHGSLVLPRRARRRAGRRLRRLSPRPRLSPIARVWPRFPLLASRKSHVAQRGMPCLPLRLPPSAVFPAASLPRWRLVRRRVRALLRIKPGPKRGRLLISQHSLPSSLSLSPSRPTRS